MEGVLEKHGWPSPYDIGYKASQAIFLVLHHADATTFFRYYNLIKEARKENKIAREDYEFYTDRSFFFAISLAFGGDVAFSPA